MATHQHTNLIDLAARQVKPHRLAIVEALRAFGPHTDPATFAEIVLEVNCIATRMASVLPTSMAPIQDELTDALVLAEAFRDDFSTEAA